MKIEVVHGNLDKAIHSLQKVVQKDNIHALLRRRGLTPNRTDRRKMKDLIADRRRVKREQRQHG